MKAFSFYGMQESIFHGFVSENVREEVFHFNIHSESGS